MSSTSQPRPLSADPPVGNLLPMPVAGLSQQTTPTMAMRPQPPSVVPLETPERVYARMRELAALMRPRPDTNSRYKVIAIDGADRLAVHGMIATLQHRITRDLRYLVRIVSEDSFYPPVNQPTQLTYFIRRVDCWGAIWDMILHASPASSNPGLYHGFGGAPVFPDHPTASFQYPIIYILPLSPLMTTIHAMQQVKDSKDPWRMLSSYWKGSFRPDVTINIGDITNSRSQNEVLRFQATDMNALIVTKEGAAGLNTTPRQIRRVVFEVEKWIRW